MNWPVSYLYSPVSCISIPVAIFQYIFFSFIFIDSAPLSYKEDLLAEINLMKRIGAHPNIVSMLGACTLSEPIALAMEYIPFGNLQMFLK